MKIILTIATIVFVSLPAIAQISISNSKWKGPTEVPRSADIDLEFTKDTFRIISQAGRGLEVMFFSQHNDSLYIRKISGASPCPEGTEAWYRIEWLDNGEKFLLQLISDSCIRRANGIKAIRINQRIRPANEIARNWSYKSLSKDSVPGINLYGAYELLKGKKSQPVIVAVISGGIDMHHEDISNVIWKNRNEIAGNNIDDDKNGYIDDEWGWNFLSDKKGNTVWVLQREETQVYKLWRDKYDRVDPARLNPTEKKEYEVFQEAKAEWQRGNKIANALKLVLRDSSAFFSAIEKLKNETEGKPNTWETFSAINPGDDSVIAAIQTGREYFFLPQQAGPAYNLLLNRRGAAWQRNILPAAERYVQFYDLDYDPLKIIADDPSNPYEKNYGSPYMIIEPDNSHLRHGTFIAGIIAAKKDGIGIDGIADNVLIMNIKAVGSGSERDKDVANAILYAVDNGAKIINMSFGKKYSTHKDAMDKAIQYAEQKDVLIVNSAGNGAQNTDSIPDYPVIAYNNGKHASNFMEIGSTTINYDSRLLSAISNYGQNTVHLFAPGAGIYAPHPFNKYDYLGTRYSGGTSTAAPYVAGVAALIKSYFPELRMVQIKKIIVETVYQPNLMVYRPGSQTLVPFSSLSKTGGILDAEAAVKKALELTKQKLAKDY